MSSCSRWIPVERKTISLIYISQLKNADWSLKVGKRRLSGEWSSWWSQQSSGRGGKSVEDHKSLSTLMPNCQMRHQEFRRLTQDWGKLWSFTGKAGTFQTWDEKAQRRRTDQKSVTWLQKSGCCFILQLSSKSTKREWTQHYNANLPPN